MDSYKLPRDEFDILDFVICASYYLTESMPWKYTVFAKWTYTMCVTQPIV